VDFEHLFNGSALNAVDAKGRVSVPAQFRQKIEARSGTKTIIIGAHDVETCLTCYDETYSRHLYQDGERRRLIEEERGGSDAAAHYARARRTFGFNEEVGFDPSGRMVLPPMMRRKGEIEDLALFVGVGGTFEIWNPRLALKSRDVDLRDLAAFRLEEKGISL
jgi:MraZ protein